MEFLKKIWRKITHTNALDQASGELELAFFEDVYRVAYAAGLSRTDRTILYVLYSTIVKLMIALVIIGEIWYAYTEAQSFDEVAACVNVIVIHLITLYKAKNMIDHRDIYNKLATSMELSFFDITTQNRRQIVRFWARTQERYVKIVLGLGNCTLAAWHLYPLVDEIDYNIMVSARLPFKYDTSFRYFFTYLIVGIAFTYTSLFVMVTELVMQAHLVPLVCQLSILGDCFRNIVHDCSVGIEDLNVRGNLTLNNEFTRKYLIRLGKLVEQHKLILKYSMELKAIWSMPMLCQMAASGVLICFIGYEATTTIVSNVTKLLMAVLYLAYNMFGLYIICQWCEEITVQAYNIGDSMYSSGWEGGMTVLPGVRATILLVIARANKPLVFSAGGMYNLSLNSFTCLVKGSYSALTVLLRFRR